MTTILGIVALAAAPTLAENDEARLENLDQRGLQLAMTRLSTEQPALVTVVPVGESRGGRRIEALRVAAGELGPGRPAVLVVANVDGPWVWTSSLALDHARRLAAQYGSDARIKALLDSTTVYVIPRVDLDAAEGRFATPLVETIASGPGVDDDRDGRQGEDPLLDVDGDGVIAWMRVPSPKGLWTTDPADPRVSIRADATRGQRGTFDFVREGRDADRDEKASEDQELDAVLNRNFPQGWDEHAATSGRFPTDEPGARALCDFLLLHPEIALVLTYGELDNVVEKPKAESKPPRESASPSQGIPEADVAIQTELGKRYAAVGRAVKGTGADAGSFQAWVESQRGLWAVNVCPWTLPLDESEGDQDKGGEKGRKDKEPVALDVKRLRWIDANDSARFLPWRPFQHPDLGSVEIGGFAPYALIEPPLADRTEIAAKDFDAFLVVAEALPRIDLRDVSARDLGLGLWEVEAVLVNDGFLPLTSALGRRSRAPRPARITLELPQGASLLAGNAQELVTELAGSGGRRELRWLVRGTAPSGMRVTLDSNNAGRASVVPEVN